VEISVCVRPLPPIRQSFLGRYRAASIGCLNPFSFLFSARRFFSLEIVPRDILLVESFLVICPPCVRGSLRFNIASPFFLRRLDSPSPFFAFVLGEFSFPCRGDLSPFCAFLHNVLYLLPFDSKGKVPFPPFPCKGCAFLENGFSTTFFAMKRRLLFLTRSCHLEGLSPLAKKRSSSPPLSDGISRFLFRLPMSIFLPPRFRRSFEKLSR